MSYVQGSVLKALREKKQMTQKQLAERLAHKAAKIAWQHTNLPLAIDDET